MVYIAMMKIEVNHYIHFDSCPATDKKLDAILDQFKLLTTKIDKIMSKQDDLQTAFNDLNDKVTALETAEDSAIALLTGIKANLDTAIQDAITTGNLDAVKAFSDKLGADTQKLSDAVAANTPAA